MGRASDWAEEELDLRPVVQRLLCQVPEGRVTTYRALAEALGDARASRAVGQIVAANDAPDAVPCYKVVHSDGRVGRYSGPGGSEGKIRRLQAEGIPVRDGCVAPLRAYGFREFATDRPLERLRDQQTEIARRVDPTRHVSRVVRVGGVDLSYRGDWVGVGAYVRMDPDGARVEATRTVEREVGFPYIPTYLAFRELPLLGPLLEEAEASGDPADVVLVDGSGQLHHRHAGIASHLGVLTGVPTVGVTKRLLYGQVETDGMAEGEVRWVPDPERPQRRLGAAVKTSRRAKPVYVSIGHRVDLEQAVELVLRASSRKLPEPIRRADALSREAARSARPTDEATGQQALNL